MVLRETGRREFLLGAGTAGTVASAEAGHGASGLGTPAVGIPDLNRNHRLKWQIDVNDDGALVYPITRADGVVFVFVYQTGPQSDSEFAVYALETETGDTRWKSDSIRMPVITTVSNDLVYAHGQQGIQALDMTDGSVEWQFQTDDEENELRDFTVTNDVAIAVTRRELVALDAADGSEHWRFSLEYDALEEEGDRRRVKRVRGLLVAGDSLYFGNIDGFTALTLADGEQRWQVPIEGDIALSVAVRDGLLVGWSNRAVYGIETDGTRRFRTPVENVRVHSVGGTVGERAAYVWGEKLTAVDLQTGRKRWAYESDDIGTGANDRRGYSPIVSDGRVYTSTGEQNVITLDADSGRKRWQFDADAGFGHWGTVAGGYAYVAGKQQIHVFDAETGREVWSLDVDGEQTRFWVSALGDSVFVGTRNGRLYAIDPPSRLVSAPVESATQFATTSTGLGLLGLLGAGLLGVGYWQAKRRESASSLPNSDADVQFGRLERLGGGPVTETHLKRVQTSDGPREGTQLVAETRLTDEATVETRREFTEAIEDWAELGVEEAEVLEGTEVREETEVRERTQVRERMQVLKGANGILPVQNYGTDPAPWFETPFLAGGSLADSWPRTYRERVEVISSAARTLHTAHREGVAHGRLAPRHIFRATADEEPQQETNRPDVRVGGWFLTDALAEARGDSDLYAPPEVQSNSEESVSGDVYRLGALARHLLIGEVLDSDPGSEANPTTSSLSSELNAVLNRALAADPEDRYDSALAFDDEFRWAALDR
jgi:outer membrane protein assembly factor BamB